MLTIQEFIKKIKLNNAVRENVPMGFGMGYPMLDIKVDRLLISVFYYRSVVRPADKTLLMPPEYMLTFEYPSGKLVSFESLRMDARFAKVEFAKPVGLFRHEAIKHLTRNAYQEQREELFNMLNLLIASLGDEGEFTQDDEKKLSDLYTMLTEPGLYPFYRYMSPRFFDRYIRR